MIKAVKNMIKAVKNCKKLLKTVENCFRQNLTNYSNNSFIFLSDSISKSFSRVNLCTV